MAQNAQQRRKNGSSKPTTGQYRKGKTERWNGTKWVKVNVVHKGQKATLNDRPVTADGKGHWRTQGDSRGRSGQSQGRYAPGQRVTTTPTASTKNKTEPKRVATTTVSGVEYRNDTGRALHKGADGVSRTSNRGYSIDQKTGARTNGHSAPKAKEKAKEKPVERRPAQVPASTKNKPTKPKATSSKNAPAYSKPSTTKGPTKSGGFIASKGSSTKGGPTADGNTYKSQIKSKRLRDALSSLKVRDYKKKK